jgi:hypothetical protein
VSILATYYTFEPNIDYGIESVSAISCLLFFDEQIRQHKRVSYYPSKKIPAGPHYSISLAEGASLFDFMFEETKEFVLVSNRAWGIISKYQLNDYWNTVPVKEVRLDDNVYSGYVIMQPTRDLLSSGNVAFQKSLFWEIESVDYEFELKDRMGGQRDWGSPLTHFDVIFDSASSYAEKTQNPKNPYFDILFPKSLVLDGDLVGDAVAINNRFWVFSEPLKAEIQNHELTGMNFVEIPISINAVAK